MAKAIEKAAKGVIKDQKKRSAGVIKYRQMGPADDQVDHATGRPETERGAR
ncbi:MAG: hypothetical protein ACLQAR_03855 [Steroidobacteraceae bacterium]